MLLLVSPAKIMRQNGLRKPERIPYFHTSSKRILEELKQLNIPSYITIMKVKETVAQENKKRFEELSFDMNGTCALETYDGMQFRSMQMNTAGEAVWSYLQEHLCILSGFYGVVHPLDSIYPYRLEMQAKLSIDNMQDIYHFWKNDLANYITDLCTRKQYTYIINLMSKEYEKSIRPYIDTTMWIDIVFYIQKNGVYKSESTQAKRARGQMVRWIGDHQCNTIEDIKVFNVDGYIYSKIHSNDHTLVFIKQ